jgi:hypothetical protein
MARFKIGDRVRVINAASGHHRRTGAITGVQHSTDEPVTQQDASELFRGYVVELDGRQIEFFISLDLEAE